MQTCTCGALRGAVRSRAAVQNILKAQIIRSLSTSRFQYAEQPSFVNEESPARQARRDAEASRQRRSGPFPFAQPQLDESVKIPWRELTAGEKVGRTIGNSSKLFVIVFGITITGLVIYAVSSELFAANSPTKLYDEATELVKNNAELQSILLQPVRFHSEVSGGRRNRRIRSTMSVDKKTGRERMTIRFYCEGRSLNTHEDESHIQRVKRWLRPVMLEPSDPTDLLPQAPHKEVTQEVHIESSSSSSWLGSMFGSLLPSAFASKANTQREVQPERLRTKPKKGAFESGEAVASFLLNDQGKFILDSLVVFYPDTRTWQWKTDVKGQAPLEMLPAQQGPTRYRFWNRKVAA